MEQMQVNITLPKFNSSPLKSYQIPIGKLKVVFQPPFFRGELLNFQGCNPILGHLDGKISRIPIAASFPKLVMNPWEMLNFQGVYSVRPIDPSWGGSLSSVRRVTPKVPDA